MESFWDFSVRTYRMPGVPDACLSLQNDFGADVNMLLYCCWVGAALGEFDDDLFARANEYSQQWAGSVVIPLREARTWMKHTGCSAEPTPTDDCMQLRERVKSVEFAAEKMQQEVLDSMLTVDQTRNPHISQTIAAVAANFHRYLRNRENCSSADVRAQLAIIVCAAFPDAEEPAVSKTLIDQANA